MANKSGYKAFYFDGAKSIDLPQYPDEAWTNLTGQADSGKESPEQYYKAIPTLFRGVRLRANALANMPFALVDKSGKDYDTSDDWQNKVGFLPNPKRLLYLTEASLTLTGKCYQWRKFNRAKTLNLRYLNPFSVTYEIAKEPNGQDRIDDNGRPVFKFQRNLGSGARDVPDGSIVYFWLPDPYVEAGQPNAYPGSAALMACGVLGSVDQAMAAFMKRGLIKPTIFVAEGMPSAEKERFESWIKQFITGLVGAFQTKVLNATKLTPVIVGEGMKELENQTLTDEKRKDIAQALEIPYSLLFSDSARGLGGGGVSEQDDLNFLEDTVIPEAEFVAEVWTEQVFEPLGLRMQPRPEALTAMQEDEAARGQALTGLVQALQTPEEFLIAADILGYDLDAELRAKIEQAIREKNERRAQVAAATQPQPQPQPGEQPAEQPQEQPPVQPAGEQNEPVKADLEKWKRKALKALERGKSPAVEFESEHIPEDIVGRIKFGLESATDAAAVKAVFEHPDLAFLGYNVRRVEFDGLEALATELRRANDLLQKTMEE